MDEVSGQQTFEVRPAREDDFAFIFATWLRKYHQASSFAEKIPSKVFFKFHHLIIERILARASTSKLIATIPGEPDVIVGYFISERIGQETVVHFAYTKEPWRNLGVQSALVAASGIDLNSTIFTHGTSALQWAARKWPGLIYNPYLL